MNKVQLIGHLGGDPEITTLDGGREKAVFNLATNDGYYKKGDWQEKTNWHRIVCWDNQAQRASRILSKGSKVLIEGQLDHRSYKDDQDRAVYVTEVVVSGPTSTITNLQSYDRSAS